MGLLIVAVLIGSVAAPLWLVMGRIHRRSLANNVSPVVSLFLALAGWLVTIAATCYGVALLCEEYAVQNQWVVIALLACSCVFAAVVGAGVGYMYLWLRTTDDSDFGRIDDQNNRD
jgi:CDP-diglyceride synthetase